MSADVFKETEGGLNFSDDPGDVWPEVAWVFVSEFSSGNGKRLAWVAAMDDIHQAAPRFAIKGGNVVPDRRVIQGLVFHPRHERSRSVGFPLDVTHSSISAGGEMEAEVESSGPGAEGKSGQGSPAVACKIASGGR